MVVAVVAVVAVVVGVVVVGVVGVALLELWEHINCFSTRCRGYLKYPLV